MAAPFANGHRDPPYPDLDPGFLLFLLFLTAAAAFSFGRGGQASLRCSIRRMLLHLLGGRPLWQRRRKHRRVKSRILIPPPSPSALTRVARRAAGKAMEKGEKKGGIDFGLLITCVGSSACYYYPTVQYCFVSPRLAVCLLDVSLLSCATRVVPRAPCVGVQC